MIRIAACGAAISVIAAYATAQDREIIYQYDASKRILQRVRFDQKRKDDSGELDPGYVPFGGLRGFLHRDGFVQVRITGTNDKTGITVTIEGQGEQGQDRIVSFATGEFVATFGAPDRRDFTFRVDHDGTKFVVPVDVTRPKIIDGVALTGVGLRGGLKPIGYETVPVLVGKEPMKKIVDKRADKYDLNLSAGIHFVFSEDNQAFAKIAKFLTLGGFVPHAHRFGVVLSANAPTDGGPSSLRVGPIWYLDRELRVGLSFGMEAVQADVFRSLYRFGDVIGPDEQINPDAVKRKWVNGWFFGLFYKIGG